MRAVIQRVATAEVRVGPEITGCIGTGLAILLGVAAGDGAEDVDWLADKIARLRIFADEDGRFARSLVDVGGESLVVSQFTLFASTRKGTRPGFSSAAAPDQAEPLYRAFVERLRECSGRPVATGRFGAAMQVSVTNDGPVTIVIDSRRRE